MIFSEPNKHKPSIVFDTKTETLSIIGSSFPENANVVYNPVIKWVDKYNFNDLNLLIVKISLDYINTSTSKKLFELLRKLNDVYQDTKNIKVEWEYIEDDEDMYESAKYYSGLVDIPFDFISISE